MFQENLRPPEDSHRRKRVRGVGSRVIEGVHGRAVSVRDGCGCYLPQLGDFSEDDYLEDNRNEREIQDEKDLMCPEREGIVGESCVALRGECRPIRER